MVVEHARRPFTAVQVHAVDGTTTLQRPDRLATEEPMEIRVQGPRGGAEPVAVTMRTPGNDFELAVGFLVTEGVLRDPADVASVAYCLEGTGEQQYNIVTVQTRRAPDAERARRAFAVSASCGVCGKATLDEIEIACAPIAAGPTVAGSVLVGLPDALRAEQSVFDATGGLHAAGCFAVDGALVALREDVGRHNAVDKVVGWAALTGQLPLAQHVLMVSGRVSFEIVQKAAVAGIPIVAAVSAPTSLAVDAARRLNVTLVGFLRDDRFNVYCGDERVAVCGAMAWPGSARIKHHRRPRRALWVGFKPYGMGETRPNAYGEIWRTIRENRGRLRYAWRILRGGVCDGCALGVAGFHDWTLSGVHLCATRLRLLRLNTMPALDPAALADVDALRKRSGAELRDLGRLGHPMVRRHGEAAFTRISWDEALTLLAERIRATSPDRLALYLTARGLTNETYYVAQKAMRFLGTNNVDNAARVCHAPSTVTLKRTIGVGATTCSYTDVINSDLIVIFGANVANAQPVFMKYLYLARKRGAQVVVVNPLREPGLERYWVPSNVESAMFGTRMADDFVPVHTGGDVAFLNGVLKVLIADGGVDLDFVREHTTGFDELTAELERQSFADLEARSGIPRAHMEEFARRYAGAGSTVLVWSMGVTQHEHGVDNVAAIVNLALARGNVGRRGAGLMPIRGHSGVQGGAEMGAYATAFPGGGPIDAKSAAVLSRHYGFAVPAEPGLSAEAMLEAAERGDLDVLWSSGGNFLEVLPDPARVEQALARVPLRVHQDIVVSSQMLVDGGTVLLLPAATRYEQRGGGTETTTERRIVFSPEVPGPRAGEARAEWEIFADVARRAHPDRADLIAFESADAVRAEIARVVPSYAGVETLVKIGDNVQWGGPMLCAHGQFLTPDGKAKFSAVAPPETTLRPGQLRLSTRRGKQFNTMVMEGRDPLTGVERDAVLLSAVDAERIGVRDGDAVLVRSAHGELRGRVHVSPVAPGNAQVLFPEGNVLLGLGRRDAVSGVPDYTTVVDVVPAS